MTLMTRILALWKERSQPEAPLEDILALCDQWCDVLRDPGWSRLPGEYQTECLDDVAWWHLLRYRQTGEVSVWQTARQALESAFRRHPQHHDLREQVRRLEELSKTIPSNPEIDRFIASLRASRQRHPLVAASDEAVG